ncbi:MAG: hypothetical protein QW507_00900 [Candidatus Nanoarchaeia archaeon]|nr:hypothetical protein [Candidatus Haiyanarchaeum thermophilum]MCW1303374.1 hypothetical protein [Candidatus Haiyanarchaeum thermophilum]MCW1306736.1 hypothetical protein [Candidatus Haiyanarchaeum thermophilum]MCW1307573.1 hypothetical protein [Candidatus Haiyanarchaeum thermophilum]MCW1308555.1 hypothetical protein [Candidatus Haiyanarchaeum thermophilum]
MVPFSPRSKLCLNRRGVIISLSLTFLFLTLLSLWLFSTLAPAAIKIKPSEIQNLDDVVWVSKVIEDNLRLTKNKAEAEGFVKFLEFTSFYPQITKEYLITEEYVEVRLSYEGRFNKTIIHFYQNV